MASETIVVIDYRAQPGKGKELKHELEALIRDVVKHEHDCLGIQLLETDDDGDRVLLYERWTSRAAYEGPHMQTPHITAFRERAQGFAAGRPAITFWTVKADVGR